LDVFYVSKVSGEWREIKLGHLNDALKELDLSTEVEILKKLIFSKMGNIILS
jgi:hypothetical protein